MIIWSGWGILAPIVAALVGGPVAMGLGWVFDRAGYPNLIGIAVGLGFLAAAAAVWVLGQRLNGAPGRELLDPRTGETVVLRPSHGLFFVPVQWWAIPLVLAGLFVGAAVTFGEGRADRGARAPDPLPATATTGTPKPPPR